MPSVYVVLKNGTSIEVVGANDAEWVAESLISGAQRQRILIVQLKETNSVQTRGKFLAEEVAGYTIDVRG